MARGGWQITDFAKVEQPGRIRQGRRREGSRQASGGIRTRQVTVLRNRLGQDKPGQDRH